MHLAHWIPLQLICLLLAACGSGSGRSAPTLPDYKIELELLPRSTPPYPLEPLTFRARVDGYERACSLLLLGPGDSGKGGRTDQAIVPPNVPGLWAAQGMVTTSAIHNGLSMTKVSRSEPIRFEVVPFTIDLEVVSGSIGVEPAVVQVQGGPTADPLVVHVFDVHGGAVASLVADADGQCRIEPTVFPVPGRFYLLQGVAGTKTTPRALPVFVPSPQIPVSIDCSRGGFQIRAGSRKEFVVTDSTWTVIEMLSPLGWEGQIASDEGAGPALTLSLERIGGNTSGLYTLRVTTQPASGGGPISVWSPIAVRPGTL